MSPATTAISYRMRAAIACVLLVVAAPSRNVWPHQSIRAGESYTVDIGRNALGASSSERVEHSGAQWIKLHFAQAVIGAGGSIRVTDEQGRVAMDVRSSGADVWALALDGSVAVVHAINASYRVDSYGAGTVALPMPQVVLGADERRDRECFPGQMKWQLSEAVGRVLFQETGRGPFNICSGFLISSDNHFLTNNHCIDSQAEATSMEVRFNYDRTACGGTSIKAYDAHNGATLIRTHAALDFTLLRLNNHADGHTAAGSHGYLEVRGHTPRVPELLYLPQYPGGGPLQITDRNCYVNMADYSEPGFAANSSLQHQCDTEGGSSGSPVMNLNNQAIAIHHTGYTGSHNAAIRMNSILPLIAADLPATRGGSHVGSPGWFWYRPQEAWSYIDTDQRRLWVYLQASGDYLWADTGRESSIANLLQKAVQSNHQLGVLWTGSTTYSDVRLRAE